MDSIFYTLTLTAHSWLRWLNLLLAAVVIIQALLGLLSAGPYRKINNGMAAGFVGSMHLQLLVGLLLYVFLSPVTQAAFANFGAAMKNADLRYFAVEHITVMVLAVVFAQVGRSISKKAQSAAKKHRMSLIFFGIALLLMLSRIPWQRLVA